MGRFYELLNLMVDTAKDVIYKGGLAEKFLNIAISKLPALML